jgi:hypothetical protein
MELEKYGLKAQSDYLAGLLDSLDIPKITVSSFFLSGQHMTGRVFI